MPTSMSERTARDQRVLRVLIIEGSANAAVLIAKLVVGISSGSLAVLGDAIHSFTDVVNNIVAWCVVRISCAPADREHPYGHRKFETLAVFGLAALLVVLSFELATRAISTEHTAVASGAWELVLMLSVLAVNIGLTIWQRYWAHKLDSDILRADASHTLADVLTTIAVIIGWQLSAIGYLWLDRVCALGVAGLVLYLAYSLFKKTVPVLVDESAIDPEVLMAAANDVAGVEDVVRVRSRWIGAERAVDMVVTVNADLSISDSHDIADQIESMLEARFDVQDTSIHIEPHLDE